MHFFSLPGNKTPIKRYHQDKTDSSAVNLKQLGGAWEIRRGSYVTSNKNLFFLHFPMIQRVSNSKDQLEIV